MGSRLAITEKRPTKSRGLGSVFFHFFDWNRMLSKKKKKLFSINKLLLPSGAHLRLTHLILSIENEESSDFYLIFVTVSKKFGGDEKMPKSKHFLVFSSVSEISFISIAKCVFYLRLLLRCKVQMCPFIFFFG